MCVARETVAGEQRQASPGLPQGFKDVPVNKSTWRHSLRHLSRETCESAKNALRNSSFKGAVGWERCLVIQVPDFKEKVELQCLSDVSSFGDV